MRVFVESAFFGLILLLTQLLSRKYARRNGVVLSTPGGFLVCVFCVRSVSFFLFFFDELFQYGHDKLVLHDMGFGGSDLF